MPVVGRRADKWQAMRLLTNSYEPQVQKAILRDLNALRGGLNVDALAAALASGGRPQAEAMLARAATTPLQLSKTIGVLEETLWAGGHVGAAGLDASLSFDVANPYAIRAAEHRGATLVKQVSGETKKALRQIVSRAIETGDPPRVQAKAIYDQVGLTTRQASRVARARTAMLASGRTVEQANALSAKLTHKLRKERALNIARTETINAANRGQQEAWAQLQREGTLSPDTGKEWITTPDDRRCDYCRAMDGQIVPIGEPFISARYGRVMQPALHPRCRCAMGAAKVKIDRSKHAQTHPWDMGAPLPPKSLGLTDPALVKQWQDEFDAKTRARLKAFREAQKALKAAGKKTPDVVSKLDDLKPTPPVVVPDPVVVVPANVVVVDPSKVTWPTSFKFPQGIDSHEQRVLYKAEFDFKTRQRTRALREKQKGLVPSPPEPMPTFVLPGQPALVVQPQPVVVPAAPKVVTRKAGAYFREEIAKLAEADALDAAPLTPEMQSWLEEAHILERRLRSPIDDNATWSSVSKRRRAVLEKIRAVDSLAFERDQLRRATEALAKATNEGDVTLRANRRVKEWRDALNERREQAGNTRLRDQVLKMLETDPPSKVRIQYLHVETSNRAMYESATDQVRRLTGEAKGFDDTFKVTIKDNPSGKGGSYARKGMSRDTNEIVMVPDGRSSSAMHDVLIHELGHNVEYADADLARASKALLKKRSAGGSVQLLDDVSHVSKDRRGTIYFIEDEWKKRGSDHYMGRLYTNTVHLSKTMSPKEVARALDDLRATELIAEGLARLVRDPVGFAKRDPEWFDLVMDGLRPNGVSVKVAAGALDDVALAQKLAREAAEAAEAAAAKAAAEAAAKKAAERVAARAKHVADVTKQMDDRIAALVPKAAADARATKLGDLSKMHVATDLEVDEADRAYHAASDALTQAHDAGLDEDTYDALERAFTEASANRRVVAAVAKARRAAIDQARIDFDLARAANKTAKQEISVAAMTKVDAQVTANKTIWSNTAQGWDEAQFDATMEGMAKAEAAAITKRDAASAAVDAFSKRIAAGDVSLAELADELAVYRAFRDAANHAYELRQSLNHLDDLKQAAIAAKQAAALAAKLAAEQAAQAAAEAAEQAAAAAKATSSGGTAAVTAVDDAKEIADAIAHAAKHGTSITGKPITWPDTFKFPAGIVTDRDKLLFKAEFDAKTRIRLRKARGVQVVTHDKKPDAEFVWPLRDDQSRKFNQADSDRLDADVAWHKSLTREEKEALTSYSRGSASINGYLRRKYAGQLRPDDHRKEWSGASATLAELLDKKEALIRSAMEKAAKAGHRPPAYAWRGINGGNGRRVLGHLKVGDTVRLDGGFQSASTSAHVAVERFSEGDDLRLEIVGARGIWLRKLGAKSMEDEMEWLLDSNATFQVVGKRRVQYGNGGRMIEFLQVRELDDEAARVARAATEARAAKEAVERLAAEQAAAAAKKAAAEAQKAAMPDVSTWKQVGPQAGSNPGGVFEGPDGTKFYVKFSQKSPEQVNVEMLTDSIYRELGIGAKESMLVRKGDQVGLAGKMIDGAQRMSESAMQASQDVLDGFVADAFVANWDVLGQGFDNIVATGGKAYRIDTGGSMFYRAQGGTKEFGTMVNELESLRKFNGKNVFGGLTEDAMKEQARMLVQRLTPERLAKLIEQAGVTGPRAEEFLNVLNGRREYMRWRFKV